MLQHLAGPDDVIAMRLSGKITGCDLDAIIDRVEDRPSTPDKTHLLVETNEIEEVKIASLPSYVTRPASLLGKSNCFGRAAVVADDAWVRIAPRLESALPGIRCRTFTPVDRDPALAGVRGVK